MEAANKKDSSGTYVIDKFDVSFLISQINDQIFTILENTFKIYGSNKLKLEEVLIIFLNIVPHSHEEEQIYLTNAVIQMYE